jgi:hypothetical protein
VDGLRLEPDHYAFTFDISTLPIKPGVYFWMVSLWDAGEKLDLWNCAPPMVVATEPMAHRNDQWAGFLNMPYSFSASRIHASAVEAGVKLEELA